MTLLDLTLTRLWNLGHMLLPDGSDAITCSCGWRRDLGTGDTVKVAALGHLFAVRSDTDDTTAR